MTSACCTLKQRTTRRVTTRSRQFRPVGQRLGSTDCLAVVERVRSRGPAQQKHDSHVKPLEKRCELRNVSIADQRVPAKHPVRVERPQATEVRDGPYGRHQRLRKLIACKLGSASIESCHDVVEDASIQTSKGAQHFENGSRTRLCVKREACHSLVRRHATPLPCPEASIAHTLIRPKRRTRRGQRPAARLRSQRGANVSAVRACQRSSLNAPMTPYARSSSAGSVFSPRSGSTTRFRRSTRRSTGRRSCSQR